MNFPDNNCYNLTLLTDIVQQYNSNIQIAERYIADRFNRLAEMWNDAPFHYSGTKQIITPDRYSLLISQGITKVKGQCLMGSMSFIVCSRFQVESRTGASHGSLQTGNYKFSCIRVRVGSSFSLTLYLSFTRKLLTRFLLVNWVNAQPTEKITTV